MTNGLFGKLFIWLESKGIGYEVPAAATHEGWAEWEKEVKSKYPIFFKVRNFLEDVDDFFSDKYHSVRATLKYIFRPANRDLIKLISRRPMDYCDYMLQVNFMIILKFKKEYEERYAQDPDAHEETLAMRAWLKSAHSWITEGRGNMNKELDKAYEDVNLTLAINNFTSYDYAEDYKEVNRIEKLINDTDTEILNGMVKYREYLWT